MSFNILTESGDALLTESGDNLVTDYETTVSPCDQETLISDAKLIDCCVPKGMQMAVLISLFCQLNDMSCDSQTLINDARCLDQCIPDSEKMAVLINLACQIVQGSGDKEIFSGNGDPTGVITPVATDAIYRQLDSLPAGLIWTWVSPGPWIAPSP